MIRVAINGFGRIGRLVFRIMRDNSNFEIVAINDLTDARQLAHLLKYDTNHRNYKNNISYNENGIIIDNKEIKTFSILNPNELPWKNLNIDLVFECSGKFVDKDSAYAHINAGAKKVIVSAPVKGNLKTIVYNVNDDILDGTEEIISSASCTTNCLAPVLKVINDNIGIVKGNMTTIHAYTNDQVILDVSHKKDINERRGRSGAMNIIPSSTGAAKAIGLVIPELDKKILGNAIRVPVSDGSLIDLVLELTRNTTVDEINNIFKNNVNETLKWTDDPIVSSDIIGSSCGALIDGLLTNIIEVDGKQLVKIVVWYDNEYGYSYQMVRTALKLMIN